MPVLLKEYLWTPTWSSTFFICGTLGTITGKWNSSSQKPSSRFGDLESPDLRLLEDWLVCCIERHFSLSKGSLHYFCFPSELKFHLSLQWFLSCTQEYNAISSLGFAKGLTVSSDILFIFYFMLVCVCGGVGGGRVHGGQKQQSILPF